jgi:hypothetical protein
MNISAIQLRETPKENGFMVHQLFKKNKLTDFVSGFSPIFFFKTQFLNAEKVHPWTAPAMD